MLALFKLINKSFWKSYVSPFFAFIFPIIFVGILGTLLGYYAIFGSFFSIGPIAVGLSSMPVAIFEFKRSVLLKRIGATPVKPWMFIVVAAIFYFCIMTLSIISTFLISLAIFANNWTTGAVIALNDVNIVYPSVVDILNNIAWGGFLWSIFVNNFSAILLGLFLVAVLKSSAAIQGIGIPILIISQFLSAQVLPATLLKSIDVVWFMGFVTPFKYTTLSLLESFGANFTHMQTFLPVTAASDQIEVHLLLSHATNIFDISTPFESLDTNNPFQSNFSSLNTVEISSYGWKAANLGAPFLFMSFFAIVGNKKFSWGVR